MDADVIFGEFVVRALKSMDSDKKKRNRMEVLHIMPSEYILRPI